MFGHHLRIWHNSKLELFWALGVDGLPANKEQLFAAGQHLTTIGSMSRACWLQTGAIPATLSGKARAWRQLWLQQ